MSWKVLVEVIDSMKSMKSMKKNFDLYQIRTISLFFIAIGIFISVVGKVRTGSLALALGMGGYSYSRYILSGMKRRIELFLPLLIAGVLFVVALTLPHAG
jgi:uncharacterized membrane protein